MSSLLKERALVLEPTTVMNLSCRRLPISFSQGSNVCPSAIHLPLVRRHSEGGNQIEREIGFSIHELRKHGGDTCGSVYREEGDGRAIASSFFDAFIDQGPLSQKALASIV